MSFHKLKYNFRFRCTCKIKQQTKVFRLFCFSQKSILPTYSFLPMIALTQRGLFPFPVLRQYMKIICFRNISRKIIYEKEYLQFNENSNWKKEWRVSYSISGGFILKWYGRLRWKTSSNWKVRIQKSMSEKVIYNMSLCSIIF